MKNELLTVAQAAELFGVTGESIRLWTNRQDDPLPISDQSPRSPVDGAVLRAYYGKAEALAWYARQANRPRARRASRIEVVDE